MIGFIFYYNISIFGITNFGYIRIHIKYYFRQIELYIKFENLTVKIFMAKYVWNLNYESAQSLFSYFVNAYVFELNK